MAIEIEARPTPFARRLPARSAVAVADVALARRTLVELTTESRGFEDAGARMLGRLRRLVGEPEGVRPRS